MHTFTMHTVIRSRASMKYAK